MTNNIISDPLLADELSTKGFAIRPLLSPEEIHYLLTLFSGQKSDPVQTGYQVSIWNEDLENSRRVATEIQSIICPKLNRFVADYLPIWCSFISKPPENSQSFFPPHRDWTFLDDNSGTSFGVWIPLVDTSVSNGALGLIPGSHKLFNDICGSPSHTLFPPILRHHQFLAQNLKIQPMKAGDLIIFDNRTIHGSPPNCSRTNRIATACMLIPKSADLLHAFLSPESRSDCYPYKVLRYKVSPEFFYRYSPGSLTALYDRGATPPEDADCRLHDCIEISPKVLTEAEVKAAIQGLSKPTQRRGIFGSFLSSIGIGA